MIRVVLDTNILISALLTPQGAPAQVLLLCLNDPAVQLCLSARIYAEYEEVMRRPKFKRAEQEIDFILNALRRTGTWIKPSTTVQVCLDPGDDVFLGCAQAADADFIVTGNARHFPLAWERTRVFSPRQFIDELC
jgi:putative PIN family toxin of toxin-antitoxin system